MSGEDEWISAAAALRLLDMPQGGIRTICKRAHVGLIKAKAARFIRNRQEADDVEVPREFWWAGGEAASPRIGERGILRPLPRAATATSGCKLSVSLSCDLTSNVQGPRRQKWSKNGGKLPLEQRFSYDTDTRRYGSS